MKRYQAAIAILLAGVGLLSASISQAGFKTSQAVVISTTGRFANGDLGYVYNTPNTIESIGCSVTGSTTGVSAYCSARNTANVFVQCSSSAPGIIEAVKSINSDSYLLFYWNDAGACTAVRVDHDSTTRPKTP